MKFGHGSDYSREDGDASGEAIKSLAAVHGQGRGKCAGKLGDQAPGHLEEHEVGDSGEQLS